MAHTTGGTNAGIVAQRALVHPVSLAAIGLLIVNDLLLKAAWPGMTTGKISDFAGLVFFPLLLAIPLGRFFRSRTATIALAVIITGVWFTAIKVSSLAAEATESLVTIVFNGSTIIVDPTDLSALVSLAVAYVLYQRSTTDSHRSHRIGPASIVLPFRKFVVVSAITIAALATIASTVSDPYPGFTDVAVDNGRVFAGEGDGGEYPLRYSYRSNDAGITWKRLSEPASRVSSHITESRDQGPVCLLGQPSICFRIDGTAIVEESMDGGATWQVGWSVPTGRSKFLSRYGSSWDPYDVTGWDLVLVGPSGNTLLVAMGDDGILRRTVDGTWTRDVLGTAEPLTAPGANILPEIVVILTLTTFTLAGAVLHARRLINLQRSIGRLVFTGLAVLLGTVVLAVYAWGASEAAGSFELVFVVIGPIGAWIGLAAVAALWSMIIEQDRQAGRRLLWRSTGAILVAAVAASLAFYAWSAGWIQSWLVATALAVSAAAAILAIGWRALSEPEAHGSNPDVETPEEEPPAPIESRTSKWRSRPSLRRWSAASLLWIAGPFMFGIVTVIALIPAYLASRWTQHRRPLARAMAAIGIGVIVSVFFGAFGPGWSNQTMASSGTWIVSLIVLRAPNRLAVWARGTLIAGVVLFAQVVGSVVDVVAFAMPLLIVAVDSLTIRAGYGQFERGQEFVPGVAIHKDAHSTPQNGEE